MFRKAISFIWDKYYQSRNPTGFVRSLGVKLGENTHFYGLTRQMFGSEPWFISIGNDCFITSGVQFVTHDGGTLILRKEQPDLEWTAPIEIGNDVYIGIRSIILPGVKIGNRCIIGAGSIVTKNIPDNSVAVGVPAKVIRTVDDYFLDMNKKSLRCGHLSAEKKAIQIRKIYRDKGWHDPIHETRIRR